MKYIKIILFIIAILLTPVYYILDPARGGANLLSGWVEALVYFPAVIIIMILMGRALGQNFKLSRTFFKLVLVEYHIWGALQQAVIFLIYAGLDAFIPRPGSIMLTALIFGVLHFPNPILMFSTMGLGMVFITHFNAYGNILIPFLFHGITASVLMYSLPAAISTDWTIWKSYADRQKNLFDKLSN